MKSASRPTLRKGADLKDESRKYAYGGRDYFSVTTVLSGDSDFHEPSLAWIGKQVSAIANDPTGLVGIWQETQDFDGNVEWVMGQVEGILALQSEGYVKNIGRRKLKQAADLGSTKHKLMQLYGEGHPPTMEAQFYESVYYMVDRNSADMDDVVSHCRSLTRWWEETNPILHISEMPVFNDDEEYAGTTDGLIQFGDYYGWFDLKPDSGFKRYWIAQLAAYRNCGFGVLSDGSNNIEFEMPTGMPAGVLMCGPERCVWRDVTPLLGYYYQNLFLPRLRAHKSQEGPLPEQGQVWKWRDA